jgi:threonine synthase
MQHRCVDCGADHPRGFHTGCTVCGGLIDVEYDLTAVELAASDNPYVRFAPLLPLTGTRDRLPSATYTPLIHAERLGRRHGLSRLFLKDETVLPTRSTKDRMAAVSLAYLHERGVRAFCASSTGNSSTAFADGITRYPDMHLYLFTAAGFVPRVQHAQHGQVTHFGLRDATFVEASACANAYADRHGLAAEGGFFNAGRREGLKLAFLEACEQVDAPIDWYVQAVSSAMGVYGAFKGAREMLGLGRIGRLPRLLCVQQESCAPMVHAYADDSPTIQPSHRVARPAGIAEAILRGDPTRAYPYVRGVVLQSGGTFTAVSESEIRAARQAVEDLEGISPCFSAAAAVAGLIRQAQAGAVAENAVVVVNLTGADRPGAPEPEAVEWVERTSTGWTARPPRPPVGGGAGR